MLKYVALFSCICFAELVFAQKQEVVTDSAQYYADQASFYEYRNTDSATYFINKAVRILESDNRHDLLKADAFLMKGRIYYIRGEYIDSYKYMLKANKLYEEKFNKVGMARTYNGQGLIMQTIGDYEESTRFFEKTLHVELDSFDDQIYNAAYINLAVSLTELKQYSEAKTYLQQVLGALNKEGYAYYRHIAWNKLGTIALEEKEYTQAANYFLRVVMDDEEANDWEKAYSYNGLGKAYLQLGYVTTALENTEKGFYYSKKVDAKWDLQQSYEIFSAIYEKNGELAKALDNYKLAAVYEDSLYNQMRVSQIELVELRKDEEERKRLIAENEFKDEKLKKNKIFLFSILFIAVFLVVLLIQHRRRIKRENEFSKQIKLQNTEMEIKNETIQEHNKILINHNQSKDKLLSILSHDLRAPVTSMEQLLELMVQGAFTEKEMNYLLEELLIQVRSTSFMLNDLLKWAKLQLDGVEVNPINLSLSVKVKRSIGSFYLAVKRKDIHVVNLVPEDVSKVYADEAHVNIIIHNLLSNAIKYTHQSKNIYLRAIEEEKTVKLSITNEGVVMKPERIKQVLSDMNPMTSEEGTSSERGEGMGLLLIKRFIKENHCGLEIIGHEANGTEFIVTFPKSEQ